PLPYRQASTAAVSTAVMAAALRPNSKSALRYTLGVHAPPATERQTTSASPGQPATAALTRNSTAIARQATALAIAVSQAVSPSRELIPREVRGTSSAGTDHATTT